jgi:6-pyruvoyltetrahydropterin/6-carboxytetrahydropterin synthase
MWIVTKEFSFEAAHRLPFLPATHKCHHLHGHSYKVVVACRGPLIPHRYWVVDYAEITRKVKPLIKQLDHSNLNTQLRVPTTAENLAKWFYDRLSTKLPSLHHIEIKETEKTNVIYSPHQ